MTAWSCIDLTQTRESETPRPALIPSQPRIQTPRTIRVKRKGDQLYMRWVNQPEATWFRGTELSPAQETVR